MMKSDTPDRFPVLLILDEISGGHHYAGIVAENHTTQNRRKLQYE